MKSTRWLAALLGVVFAAAELHAQGIANANPAVRGSGITFSSSRSSRSRGILVVGYPSGFYGPIYGNSFGFSGVTIVQAYTPPSAIVIVMPRSDPLIDDRPPNDIVRIRPRRKEDRDREKEARPPEPPVLPELIPAPQPLEPIKPPPPKMPEPPRVQPAPDPAVESARHLAIGREAFTVGEYGRAAFRFRQAATLTPDQALPNFLLAQAYLALGKYRDAVDAIRAGMALEPTWPTTGVRPRDLYGNNVADYPEHLQQLGAALARHADDPVLIFLSAYFLWFDGRKVEARPLFEKAAPLVPDRAIIDRFLQTMVE